MMKIIKFITAFFFAINIYGQNLISNESFEKTKKCPEDLGELDRASDWHNPTKGTPDLFSSCNKDKNKMGVPENYMGSQFAKDGESYAGFIAYAQRSSDYREYVAQKLSKNLKKDSVYKISFYISLADYSNFAISTIGVYFCDQAINSSSWNPINAEPQFETPEEIMLNDKQDWIEITFEYTATGEERYVIIGNFRKDSQSKIETLQSDNPKKSDQKAYYYIDCVSIELCPETDCSLILQISP
jgi:OmpA-OmpF porin, OOP family